MTQTAKKNLYWSPRVLCIIFAAFISLFALDVFAENQGFWKTILGLLMHLIPTFLIIIFLIIAWRWEWVGFIVYAILGTAYIIEAWGEFPIDVYLVIAGPLYLIAFLFLFNWLYRRELNQR